jgi:DNA-binding PadR family transcriptional regulator
MERAGLIRQYRDAGGRLCFEITDKGRARFTEAHGRSA